MNIVYALLIAIGFVVALVPLMLFFAWLNKVDPFVLERDLMDRDSRSIAIVSALYPLFYPLILARRLVIWLRGR